MNTAVVFISVRTKTARGVMQSPAKKLASPTTPGQRRCTASPLSRLRLSSELSQCEGGLLPHVSARVFERGGQSIDGARVANLPEGKRHLFTDVGDAVFERDDQRFDRPAIANLPEREGRLLAHVGIGVLQCGNQRLDRAPIANLAERKHCLFPD